MTKMILLIARYDMPSTLPEVADDLVTMYFPHTIWNFKPNFKMEDAGTKWCVSIKRIWLPCFSVLGPLFAEEPVSTFRKISMPRDSVFKQTHLPEKYYTSRPQYFEVAWQILKRLEISRTPYRHIDTREIWQHNVIVLKELNHSHPL